MRATHRTKRQIEELIAELQPRPDAPAVMRKLPDRTELRPDGVGAAEFGPEEVSVLELRPDGVAQSNRTPAVVQPLAPGRYKVQFTASAVLHDKLERLRALMRSRVPDGDLAAVIEEAVTEKLERLEARRFANTTTPRKSLAMPTSPVPRATSRPRSGAR
jgi:hypothetical protein